MSQQLDAIDVEAVGNAYTLQEKLGEGSYGVVYRAENKDTGALVAIKKLRLDGFSEGVPATAIREITLLQELNFPHVVRLLEVLCERHRLYLVFELLREDLHSLIVRHTRANQLLPLPLIQRYAKQMLLGLWYCHNNLVVHRDLKPGNVLVSTDGKNVKLADFGLARAFELPLCTYTREVVTLWYRAPEILLGEKRYTAAVDVWSVGCILLEMATGRAVFRGESEINQLHKTFQVIGTPTEETWPGVQNLRDWNAQMPRWPAKDLAAVAPHLDAEGAALVTAMLQANPKARPTVAQCLEHRWFSGVHD